MPANIPNLSAVHAVGQQFTHNPFKAASKGLNRVSNNQVAAATRQRAAAREAYYSDAMSTIRNGRQAFGQQQRQAASASRTMQQQRNYAHGQAIAEQKRRDRQTGAPAAAPSAPAATFSHAPQAQSPSQGQQQMFSHGPSGGSITPQRIPQATFSHQFSGGGQQSPSAAATPTFSHGGAPTPTASVPRSPRGVTSMQFSHPEE
jgi:hypothetical protein